MVPGCPYSGGMSRLCDPHIAQWNGLRSGGQHVAAAEFTGAAVPLPRPATGACAFPGCSYEISGDGLCDGHRYRWSRVGRPPLDRLPTELASRTVPGFSVSGMGPLAALEFQYLLQLRTDQRRSKIYPSAWTRTVITFLQEGVSSVRDRPVEYWRGLSPNHSLVPSIFTTLSEALEDLDEPAEEWERLVWRPERLGFSVEERQRVAPLDFTVITQPWLREKVMRYARLRLARLELRSVARNLVSFKLFSGFLADRTTRQCWTGGYWRHSLAGSAAGPWGRRAATTDCRSAPEAAAAHCPRCPCCWRRGVATTGHQPCPPTPGSTATSIPGPAA